MTRIHTQPDIQPQCWVKQETPERQAKMGDCEGELNVTELYDGLYVRFCSNPKHDPDPYP